MGTDGVRFQGFDADEEGSVCFRNHRGERHGGGPGHGKDRVPADISERDEGEQEGDGRGAASRDRGSLQGRVHLGSKEDQGLDESGGLRGAVPDVHEASDYQGGRVQAKRDWVPSHLLPSAVRAGSCDDVASAEPLHALVVVQHRELEDDDRGSRRGERNDGRAWMDVLTGECAVPCGVHHRIRGKPGKVVQRGEASDGSGGDMQ